MAPYNSKSIKAAGSSCVSVLFICTWVWCTIFPFGMYCTVPVFYHLCQINITTLITTNVYFKLNSCVADCDLSDYYWINSKHWRAESLTVHLITSTTTTKNESFPPSWLVYSSCPAWLLYDIHVWGTPSLLTPLCLRCILGKEPCSALRLSFWITSWRAVCILLYYVLH